MRGWLFVVGALAGCRGFFDTPPVSPDAAPDAPGAPVGYVQSAASSVVTAPTVTVGFPLSQQGGNANLLVIGWSGGSLVSLSDTNHNDYMAATGPTQAGDGWNQQIYLALGIGGAPDTINVSFDANVYAHVGIVEYSGIAGVDQSVASIGTAGDTPTTSILTTTHAHDLLVAVLTAQNGVNATVVSPSYTTRLSGPEYLIADQEVTTTAGYTSTTNVKPQADWVMQLVALRAD